MQQKVKEIERESISETFFSVLKQHRMISAIPHPSPEKQLLLKQPYLSSYLFSLYGSWKSREEGSLSSL